MATKSKNSEAAILEQFRVALENVTNQPEIAANMAEYGYHFEIINEGKMLLEATRAAYNANKTEDDETSAAYKNFSDKKNQLEEMYSLHRKKAKVVFRNDPLVLDKLAVSGVLPKAYVKWLEAIRKFYSDAIANPDIQFRLERLRVSRPDLDTANVMINELETARAVYLRELGESQEATRTKDAAFAKIDDWMGEFYAVAKIALEEKPQLLEALGKSVKS